VAALSLGYLIKYPSLFVSELENKPQLFAEFSPCPSEVGVQSPTAPTETVQVKNSARTDMSLDMISTSKLEKLWRGFNWNQRVREAIRYALQ
jgi:hypothetical protein